MAATETVPAAFETELPQPPRRFDTIRSNLYHVGITTALAGVAVAETWARNKGYLDNIHGPLQEGCRHVRHTVLGYGGALAAYLMTRNRSPRVQAVGVFVGMTVMNFAVGEAGQSIMLNDEGTRDLGAERNLWDNYFDYITAAAGAGAFLKLNETVERRRLNRELENLNSTVSGPVEALQAGRPV
jgi:hypothetical protein